MSERIYRWLLSLYPRCFRERYESAAIALFRDRIRAERGFFARVRLWLDLIRDAGVSIPREYRRDEHPAAVPVSNGFPSFYTGESCMPRGSALIPGAVLSLAIFAGMVWVMRNSGYHPVLLIGSHHPSPSHILPAKASAVATKELDAEIKVKPYPSEPPTPAYFKLLLVLGVLDADRDGAISAAEIANAPVALKKLDTNRDGRLVAEECGLRLPAFAEADPRIADQIRAAFMRLHPVLAALDADHDGIISANEIKNAKAALWTLDLNGDRRLTESELRPEPVRNGLR